jgi:hypothetical protein
VPLKSSETVPDAPVAVSVTVLVVVIVTPDVVSEHVSVSVVPEQLPVQKEGSVSGPPSRVSMVVELAAQVGPFPAAAVCVVV